MDERVADMVSQLDGGATLQEVGEQYGISRERVRQLTTGLVDVRKRFAAREAASYAMVDQYKDEIMKSYLAGTRGRDIARNLGLPATHVASRIRLWREELGPLVMKERTATKTSNGQGNKALSDEEAVIIIQFIAEAEDRVPSLGDYTRWQAEFPDWPSTPGLLIGRTWSHLIRLAGFTPRERPRGMGLAKFSDEDAFAAIAAVADIVGHLPSIGEYTKYKAEGTITHQGLRRRFGGWIPTLQAFINYQKENN